MNCVISDEELWVCMQMDTVCNPFLSKNYHTNRQKWPKKRPKITTFRSPKCKNDPSKYTDKNGQKWVNLGKNCQQWPFFNTEIIETI